MLYSSCVTFEVDNASFWLSPCHPIDYCSTVYLVPSKADLYNIHMTTSTQNVH